MSVHYVNVRKEHRLPLFTILITGDAEDRVNVHPLIVTMHTVWFREHNRVAHQLANLMPGRDDEFLFHEARRIVVAEMQHITYTEYLPFIIG